MAHTDTEGTGTEHLQLAGMMIGSGVLHLVAPGTYERTVPRQLPDARKVVFVSGVVELACGALLLVPATRKVGGWATVALLAAVFPANVQMMLDAGTEHQAAKNVPAPLFRAVALARLPMQVPMIRRALRVARG